MLIDLLTFDPSDSLYKTMCSRSAVRWRFICRPFFQLYSLLRLCILVVLYVIKMGLFLCKDDEYMQNIRSIWPTIFAKSMQEYKF
jgi:hypothetical protein